MENLDKNKINERIETIKKEMEVAKTTFIKLEGHLTEATHWLSELEKIDIRIQNSELIGDADC